MKAKKRYGQHFLTNETIAQNIANSLSLEDYQHVIEVGPGKGVLSKYLMTLDTRLHYIEADADMVGYFQKKYPDQAKAIIHQDFLRSNLRDLTGDKSFAIIGNFPYNISSQIIFKCLDDVDYIPEIVGMFQLEMAERIIASPDSKDYGIISVLTQLYYSGKKLFNVKAGNFDPPPRVESAVIRLVRKKEPLLPKNVKLFRQIVKGTFNQRRKMIRNTLKSIIPKEKRIEEHPLYTQRPEQLSVSDFIHLTNWCDQLLKT